jgi:hypothetical protein
VAGLDLGVVQQVRTAVVPHTSTIRTQRQLKVRHRTGGDHREHAWERRGEKRGDKALGERKAGVGKRERNREGERKRKKIEVSLCSSPSMCGMVTVILMRLGWSGSSAPV